MATPTAVPMIVFRIRCDWDWEYTRRTSARGMDTSPSCDVSVIAAPDAPVKVPLYRFADVSIFIL